MGLGLGGFDGSALRVAADTLGIGDFGMTNVQAGTSFEIQETGGKTIVLRDRACPFPEVEWPTEQRSKKTNYPGNPAATIQVLGFDLNNLTIEGEWNERFLSGAVMVDGLSKFLSVPELADIFDRMARGGREVRVQWLGIVRFGILKKFTPTWLRKTDAKWRMEFEWTRADDNAPEEAKLPSIGFGLSDLMKAINFAEDLLALAPDLASSLSAACVSQIRSLSDEVSLLVQLVRAIESLINLPTAVFGAIEAAVSSIRDQCTELIRRLSGARMSARDESTASMGSALTADPSLPNQAPQSPAAQQAAFESWSRTLAKTLAEVRHQALMTSSELRQRVRAESGKRLTVREGDTLALIAAREYGSDEYATYLAHVNRLQTTLVPPGTVLLVPSRPYGGAPLVEPTGTMEEQVITLTG
jgi:hypothetical protein